MSGPFVTNGYDRYEKSSALYWYVWIFWLLYVVLFLVYVGVYINNVSFLYSYTYNPGAPGTLVSTRYDFQWTMILFSLISNFLILVIIPISIMYRYDYGCTVTTWVFFFLGYALLVFALIGLGVFYGAANGQEQFGNIFNDLEWCCVEEIFMNPINMCPNTLGCDPPKQLKDLSAESTAEAIFWFIFVFVVLNAVYVIVCFVMWFSPPGATDEVIVTTRKAELKEEPVEDYVVSNSARAGKLSGLRERKKN